MNKEGTELLAKVVNMEQLLNQMFKDNISFSFNKEVIYNKRNIHREIETLIKQCSDFYNEFIKNKYSTRPYKKYEPIYWWYRFGVAKELGFSKINYNDINTYKMIQSFKCDSRKQFNKKKRRRSHEGLKDYYDFSEEKQFKIKLLESIDISWNKEEQRWNKYYPILCQYYKEMRHTFVAPSYKTKDGYYLGKWVSMIIKRKDFLSTEKKELLKAVEFPYRHLQTGGTSFREQALYYYIKHWYPNAESRIMKGDFEFDVYIPGPPVIAIEYDGYYSHKSDDKFNHDIEKDKYCIDPKHKIELVRVREKGLKDTLLSKNFFLKNRRYEDFDIVVKEVVKYVCHTDMVVIDTSEFRDEIIRQYCNLESLPQYKNYRKLIVYYKSHLQWPTKADNYELWRLMCLFRNAKKGKYTGIISNSWLDELERMNFPFDPYNERFEKFMAHLQRYCDINGDNVDINKMGDYVDNYDGTPYNLGSQLRHIRKRHPDNIRGHGTKYGRVLTDDQIKRLEEHKIEW